MENEIRLTGIRLNIAQRIAGIGSWEHTINTKNDYWSPQMFRLLGYKNGEVKPSYERFIEHVHPDDRAVLDTMRADSLAGRPLADIEVRMICRDGRVRIFWLHAGIITDGTGKPAVIHGTFQDITDRKRMEGKLIESDNRYRAVVEDQAEPICRFRPDGSITFVNGAMKRLCGTAADGIVQNSLLSGGHGADGVGLERLIETITPEHATVTIEQPLKCPDGRDRIISWTIRGIFTETGELSEFQAVGRDITDLRRAEERRKDALKLADRSARLASMSTLAAGVAHEINQPLTSLKITVDGMRYWLKHDVVPGKVEIRESLEFISEQTGRISDIIHNMRRMIRSDTESGSEEVDVNRAVLAIFYMLGARLRARSIRLVTDLDEKAENLKTRKSCIEQIVVNLVSNAIDALVDHDIEDKIILVRTLRIDDDLQLTIADNGPGIPEEIIDRIFDPFFTTKLNNTGTGLGLAITHMIVDNLGGGITVKNDSEMGGAVFDVRIPCTETDMEIEA